MVTIAVKKIMGIARASVKKVGGILQNKTVTLQPSSGIDTYLMHYAGFDDTNFSTNASLTVQPYSASTIKRVLIAFDLSSIPAGATILSAVLGLKLTSAYAGEVTIEAHEITRSWTLAGVTWNKYDGSNAWATPGGDFDAAVIDSVVLDGTVQFYEWDITASIVQGWLSTNNGLLLKASNEALTISDKYFAASENATPGNRPYLRVTYTGIKKFMGVSNV